MRLRKQYHFWPGERGVQAWDVHRLVELVKELPVKRVPLAEIHETIDAVQFAADPTPDHVGISPQDLSYD